MNRIVQILGPTGVGKSEIAVIMAERFDGEIISADSVQVYKGFNIGSSKILESEKAGIPHHMIDIFQPTEQFNVNIFLNLSVEIITDINNRGKLPVVCGGTALYLRAMINGIFIESETKRISRSRIEELCNEKGLEYLWNKLFNIDREYAEKIGKNDRKRIIRGLDIYYNNGIIPSNISNITIPPFKGYEFIRIGLQLPREQMYEMIDKRVDKMIKNGLMEEVKELRRIYERDCSPMASIGYKELNMVLDNEIGEKEAVELIKQHSRNFAKRQMSWFRRENDITWFTPLDVSGINEFLKNKLNG